jgi:hypothetical protein
MEPAMRKRMGMEDPAPNTEEEAPSESATLIAPKAMLGGKQWKAGEEIVFKIKSIDPESGDAELTYAPEKPGESDKEPTDSMSAMDESFPDGEDEQGSMMGGY